MPRTPHQPNKQPWGKWGALLKEWRDGAGLTQYELGMLIARYRENSADRIIRWYEKGERFPPGEDEVEQMAEKIDGVLVKNKLKAHTVEERDEFVNEYTRCHEIWEQEHPPKQGRATFLRKKRLSEIEQTPTTAPATPARSEPARPFWRLHQRPITTGIGIGCVLLAIVIALFIALSGAHEQAGAKQRVVPETLSAADQTWLKAVHNDLLNRYPTAQEISHWASVPSYHNDSKYIWRAAVLSDVLSSRGYLKSLINADYSLLLGRLADPDGLAAALRQLSNGARDELLLEELAGSAEFLHYAGGTYNSFLTTVYEKFLQRKPSAAEMNFWIPRLLAGTAKQEDVAHTILSSGEYYGKLMTNWYRQFLRRCIDSTAKTNGTRLLSEGNPDELVIRDILESDEYYDGVTKGFLPNIVCH